MTAPGSRRAAAAETEPGAHVAAREKAPVRPRSADLLVETRQVVDRILDRLPRNVVEARERIAEELWADPRPDELQVIMKIASDHATPGPRRDLPRHLLALRSRVERTLGRYRGLTGLRVEEVRDVAESLRLLAAATSAFDRVMSAAIASEATGSVSQRDDLAEIHRRLAPPKESLASAAALAPMLVRVAEAAASGDTTHLFEGFAPEEAAVLARFAPRADEPPRPFDREGLEACCLRWLISEDLAAAVAPAGADERETSTRRLRIDVAVYRNLSDRLQALQDSALAARHEEVAERLGRFRRLLFSTYQKLAIVLREVSPSQLPDARPAPAVATRPAVPQRNRKQDVERDRALRDALAGVCSGEQVEAPAPELPPRRRRWKLHAGLVATAGLMTVFWLLIPAGPPPRIETTVADYAAAADLAEVESVGTLLYARVDMSWADRAEAERLSELEAIGRVAVTKGFAAVHLVDPSGTPLGDWSTENGAALAAPPPQRYGTGDSR